MNRLFLLSRAVAALAAVGAIAGFSAEARAQVAYSPAPAMTGAAGAPKTVGSGGQVIYVITQTDKDTFSNAVGPNTTDVDLYLSMSPARIESMVSGYSFSRRGIDVNGTATWDVVGTAIANTSSIDIVTHDRWRLRNDQNPQTVLCDEEVYATQTVIITPAQVEGPSDELGGPPTGGGGSQPPL